MKQLAANGRYEVNEPWCGAGFVALFWSDFADDVQTIEVYPQDLDQYQYLVDTHNAAALHVCERWSEYLRDMRTTIIASTASPFKFGSSVRAWASLRGQLRCHW